MKRSFGQGKYAWLVALLALCLLSATLIAGAAPRQPDAADALAGASAYPVWAPNTAYQAGAIVSYSGALYRCLQAHTSQADWHPQAAPALWERSADPGTPTTVASPSATRTSTQQVGTGPNLIKNPGFELDADRNGKPDSWGTNALTTRSSESRHGGSYALKHAFSLNSSYVVSQTISGISPGVLYMFQAWTNIPATTNVFSYSIELLWRDAGNAVIMTNLAKRYTAPTGGWVATSNAFESPPGSSKLVLRMRVSSLKALVYADDFSLRREGGPAPTATRTRTATRTPTAPASTPIGYRTYVVVSGDTLFSIAARFNSKVPELATLNRLDLAEPPRSGRALVIPVFSAGGEPGAGGMVIYRANVGQPRVALTFDTERWEGSPSAVYSILDTLRSRGVHATFFLCGNWTTDLATLARAILADGHEIGNHSMTHPDFTTLTAEQMTSEISQLEQLILAETGQSTRPYFRLPYGSSSPAVTQALAQQGYLAYHWNAVDAGVGDWINATRSSPPSGYGSILLIHTASGNAGALGGWLDQIIGLGITPTTLSDALR